MRRFTLRYVARRMLRACFGRPFVAAWLHALPVDVVVADRTGKLYLKRGRNAYGALTVTLTAWQLAHLRPLTISQEANRRYRRAKPRVKR